jgi:hypothetical protein
MPTLVVRTPVGYVPAEVGDPDDGLVQTRRLRFTFNNFDNAGPFPSTNIITVGSVLPNNVIVLGSTVLVTTAFTAGSNPRLDLGYSGGTGSEIADNLAYDLPTIDTYVTEDASLPPVAAQIIATFTTDAVVLAGEGEIIIRFVEL